MQIEDSVESLHEKANGIEYKILLNNWYVMVIRIWQIMEIYR